MRETVRPHVTNRSEGCTFVHIGNKSAKTMKHPYTFSALAIFLMVSGMAQAQLVQLTDTDGNVVTGTTIYVTADFANDTNQVLESDLSTQNISGATHTINVKRYEVNVPHGTQNYFCWDVCYGARDAGQSPLWVSTDPISVTAGQTVNGFHAYYMPWHVDGPATFRYVWYDTANENDSSYVDFVFNAQVVGINEVAGPVRNFTAYPNPSVGGDVTLDYDLATVGAGTRLAVYNMLGERKLVRSIGAAQGRVVLHEGDLASGVWFAVLERNGHALATKRLVVAR